MNEQLTVIDRDPNLSIDQPGQLFAAILQAVGKGGMDPKAMSDLYDFHERIKADKAREAFLKAMKLAQHEMRPVVKNAKGENGRYANLEAIDKAIRPIYDRHGFTLSFGEGENSGNGQLEIVCKCFHDAGHTELYRLKGALDIAGPKGGATKTGIQALGSSNSYLIRYLTRNIFNIITVDEDNDGASVSPITQEQADEIYRLFEQIGWSTKEQRAKFYTGWKVNSVEELPSHRYATAINQLRDRARKA